MNIEKVNIKNFKCFYGSFSIHLNEGLNILVGNNEEGKSTIIEAINLALTGYVNGRYLRNELSQYLFNNSMIYEYISGVNSGKKLLPPEIEIEVFFRGNTNPLFEGNYNSERVKGCGVIYKIEIDPDYQDLYSILIAQKRITTLPIEYYKISWSSFARESVNSKTIPIKSVLIDSSSHQYINGSDVYISRIVNNDLDELERVNLSQAYRNMKQAFMEDPTVVAINNKINIDKKISNKTLSINVDLSPQNSWEHTMLTFLDEIPFHHIGKGEQSIVKTNLALGNKKALEANVILIEEPENHLSHTKLNELLRSIAEGSTGKQVLISTHSNFVSNKLGLDNLILLKDRKTFRFDKLSEDTYDFYKKLPGYQTLRLLLCKKAILVEGDSDELIIQKAYLERHNGHLPIEDGIDVISVKLTFKRFLEIATELNQPVAVVTDNDGDYESKIIKKYEDFNGYKNIKVFFDDNDRIPTLEPQFVQANLHNLDALLEVLEIKKDNYETSEKIIAHMSSDKPSWALKVFSSNKVLHFPDYINRVIDWCDE